MNKHDAMRAVHFLPYVCKAVTPERWADIGEYVFIKDFLGPSPYKQKTGERSYDRVAVLFGFTAFEHDRDTAAYCRRLFSYACDIHRNQSHNDDIPDLEEQKALLLEEEKSFPEVEKILSVELASADDGWNG